MTIHPRAVSKNVLSKLIDAPEAHDPLHLTILMLINNSRQEHSPVVRWPVVDTACTIMVG